MLKGDVVCKRSGILACTATLLATCLAGEAHAVELPKLGGKTVSLDISNTTELLYNFNNRKR